MTTLLQTLVPCVVAAETMPSSRQKESLASIDQQGPRRRKGQEEEPTAQATVPPPTISVHGRIIPPDLYKPGIVNVIRVLSSDS